MKHFTLLTLAAGALVLTACGGNFAKRQSLEQMTVPVNCAGLHLKNAEWHYTNEFDQKVDVVGTCKKGMKHGNFTFKVNGQDVAVTKYSKDQEQKTTCMASGQKTRTPHNECMQEFTNLTAKQALTEPAPSDEANDLN